MHIIVVYLNQILINNINLAFSKVKYFFILRKGLNFCTIPCFYVR